MQEAEETIATTERRKAAKETRKIFGLPASATAAQLLAVERKVQVVLPVIDQEGLTDCLKEFWDRTQDTHK